MAVDPFEGVNQGLRGLQDTMLNIYQMKRQDHQMERQAQQDARANRLADLQYQQLKEDDDFRKGLRTAMSNPQTTRTTSVIPSQPTIDVGIPGQKYMPPPDMDMIGADRGNVSNLRELGLMSPAPTSPYQPERSPASPLAQAYNEGRVATTTTTQTPAQAGAEYAMKQGRSKEAVELISLDDAMSQYAAKVQNGQANATDFYKAKNELEVYKNFVTEVGPLLKTANGKALAQTIAQKYAAMYPDKAKGFDLGLFQVKDDAIVTNLTDPATGATIGRLVNLPDGTTHFEKSSAADTAHNVQEVPAADGKTAQKFQYNPQTQRYDIPLGQPYAVKSQVPNVNIHTTNNTGAASDAEFWAKAITDGRAVLSDIPSRGNIRTEVVKLIEKQGGTDYAANKADNSAFASSIAQQQKQIGAMGSFVKNMDAQISKVEKLSKNLQTFDTRLLNVPLRAIRGRIAGSAEQAKYDMYLTEIESEIGKLATGSAGSVAELSIGAQEKWAKIHDKNLSVNDMLSLLKETSHAGKLRMKSVEDQLAETRKQMRARGGNSQQPQGGNLQAGTDFIKSQYTAYQGHGLREDAIQTRIYSKMKQRGWDDAAIGAAWRAYKGQ